MDATLRSRLAPRPRARRGFGAAEILRLRPKRGSCRRRSCCPASSRPQRFSRPQRRSTACACAQRSAASFRGWHACAWRMARRPRIWIRLGCHQRRRTSSQRCKLAIRRPARLCSQRCSSPSCGSSPCPPRYEEAVHRLQKLSRKSLSTMAPVAKAPQIRAYSSIYRSTQDLGLGSRRR